MIAFLVVAVAVALCVAGWVPTVRSALRPELSSARVVPAAAAGTEVVEPAVA